MHISILAEVIVHRAKLLGDSTHIVLVVRHSVTDAQQSGIKFEYVQPSEEIDKDPYNPGRGSFYRLGQRTGFSAKWGMPELCEICTEAAALLKLPRRPFLRHRGLSVSAT